MSLASESDTLLVQRIRRGEPQAWDELIARFEGRLLAFVQTRIGRREASEDVVQETFVGFLTSLPHFDESRSLESYLFSIAAHKLTDYLRREGRRPVIPLAPPTSQGAPELPDGRRAVSSLARSGERKSLEADALARALREQLDYWRERNEWTKLKCMELLQVRGLPNKQVAAALGLTEQQVANFKFDFLARLRKTLRKLGLNQDVFPELSDTAN
ncbi:MAG: sigma-70 family RNA polymerase sigma factor [Planctomycetales bacterium]|nr:sigma-70 family RNA polymerase sigma factor [Planctomycetales bacterium]NIP85024.1 sigma-70 family RNA polymerase sigma factor [Planctomycetales bacterium]